MYPLFFYTCFFFFSPFCFVSRFLFIQLCFQSTSVRRHRLCVNGGFTCNCTLCEAGGEEDGQSLYENLLHEIKSGRANLKEMRAKLKKVKTWLDKYYDGPNGKFMLDDAQNGINMAMSGYFYRN